MTDFTLNNGSSAIVPRGCHRNSHHMLPVTDWLADLPTDINDSDLVEVQFKNTRKGFYRNTAKLPLEKGTMVAVDAAPGHDIGEVTLTGKLVAKQMQKYHIDLSRYTIHDIFRIATENDLRKSEEAKAKEHETMIRARQIVKSLGLEMKVGDVEYQGDGTKAIFYYIADGRVDFRQLIKVYAETFRVRIEMKQIGARQEAGRIGGTGPCGRELCCSTWMTNFHSVGTGAARIQNISLTPQKLAGQCAKLKCCLNYETDIYEEATAKLPPRSTVLQTITGDYYFFSADPLAEKITYSTDQHVPANLETLTIKQAREVIAQNEKGIKPAGLGGEQTSVKAVDISYQSGDAGDSLTRFDKKRRRDQQEQRGDKQRSRDNRNADNAERPSRPNGNEVKEQKTGRPPRPQVGRPAWQGDSDGFTNRRRR